MASEEDLGEYGIPELDGADASADWEICLHRHLLHGQQ
jgi:hypothetical protein